MIKPAHRKLRVLSFFSGAMGLDLGLEQAGLEVILACDSDATCRATIKANRPDLPVLSDLRNYDAAAIFAAAGLSANSELDVVAGGPPCQSFSTAGARRGLSDKRGNVFIHYIDLLLALKPRYIVLENVRGLLSAPLVRGSDKRVLAASGGALLYVVECLRAGGYQVSFNLYNAAHFGVPQLRERVVLLGNLSGPKLPYLRPTHCEGGAYGLLPWRTLGEALSDLPCEPCDHFDFPEKRRRFYRLLKAGQNWRDLPQELQPIALGRSFYVPGGKTGFYRRLAWDRPACTLVTSPIMPATDICHPEIDRPLSVQEYRRIQMFPDSWRICGNLAAQYRQIGNAVPLGLSAAIGRALVAHAQGKLELPPSGFTFSRYQGCDEVSWEAKVRARMGLRPGEFLLTRPEIAEVSCCRKKSACK